MRAGWPALPPAMAGGSPLRDYQMPPCRCPSPSISSGRGVQGLEPEGRPCTPLDGLIGVSRGETGAAGNTRTTTKAMAARFSTCGKSWRCPAAGAAESDSPDRHPNGPRPLAGSGSLARQARLAGRRRACELGQVPGSPLGLHPPRSPPSPIITSAVLIAPRQTTQGSPKGKGCKPGAGPSGPALAA